MTTPAKSRSRIPLGTRNQPEATRDTILRAAAAEFAMEGLAGARMDAIARSAGVNKALLYYYFHDKDALYGAVLDRFFGPMFLRLTGVLDSAAPAGNRILNYARAHFDTIAEAPHYARLFQGEMMSAGRGTSPHLARIVEEYSRPLSLRMQTTLKAGIAGGEFRPVDVLQFIPSMVATIVFYFVTAPVRQLLQGTDPFSPQAIQARRAAVLDQIAAALFADREAGLRLAAQIAAEGETPGASLLTAAKPHHRVAARRRK
jgi:TetR/AcrR family transcriptional regulator